MKIDNFTNLNQCSKTLCFSLLPVGKTLENFEASDVLGADTNLSERYTKAKGLIDRYHKHHIDEVLNDTQQFAALTPLADKYMALYAANRFKTKEMADLEEEMRVIIAKAFADNKKLFSKEMITEIMPKFLTNTDELATIQTFNGFTTYFANFYTHRKLIYSSEEKANTVPYRTINENLPTFIDNINIYNTVRSAIAGNLSTMAAEYPNVTVDYIDSRFTIDAFCETLSQSQIEAYNLLLSGYSLEDGTKIQGLNEYINLVNAKTKSRLPKLQQLKKQILSDRATMSFVLSAFEKDEDVINSINDFYSIIEPLFSDIRRIFSNLKGTYGLNCVYIKNDEDLTALSNDLLKDWAAVKKAWCRNYDSKYTKPIKNQDAYIEARDKAYKAVKSFSLNEIQQLITPDISDYYKTLVFGTIARIVNNHTLAKFLLTQPLNKKLANSDNAIALIKNLLDEIKNLERILRSLTGTNNKDNAFYGDMLPIFDVISDITPLYNKVRNYITKKPYSDYKIKLNFGKPSFLSGWSEPKKSRCAMLCKDGKYYLAVCNTMPENWNAASSNDTYKLMHYKLIAGPNKFLPLSFFNKNNRDLYKPSDEIIRIYEQNTFKKGSGFNIDDCRKLIDYYKRSLSISPNWSCFNFTFKPTDEYENIGEFYKDVANAAYMLTFSDVDVSEIDAMVESGEIYLFQIYNKDFSPASKGTPNLHTMYFKALFDPMNLNNVVYKLNGGAEMFYRPASIAPEDIIVHPKNQPIDNKNPNNPKKQSTYKYDIVKDKRFTKPQFSLHLAVTMNFQAPGVNNINPAVRTAIKNSDENYVIGVHRGEQNLIYICVIDSKGNIVEQRSLNDIVTGCNVKTRTSYRKLLDAKEKERAQARQNWTSINNIKNLKEGYISQAIHEICDLIVKYDAVVALEDLTSNFKNSRSKIEKQIYQKLEKMLIDKLEYMVNKHKDPSENGGLYHAYQLTNKFKSFSKMGFQNGFLFYVNPSYISLCDPTTGFVNLLRTKYTNIKDAKDLISKFDAIEFDGEYFKFTFDYRSFGIKYDLKKTKWTAYSNGMRTKVYRDPTHGQWIFESVDLTEELKNLFGNNLKQGDLKDMILSQNSKDFFKGLLDLITLMLQMRNKDKETDYLVSPVKNSKNEFFDSRYSDANQPANIDANGAYNNARKALIVINRIKNATDEELTKLGTTVSTEEWLNFI